MADLEEVLSGFTTSQLETYITLKDREVSNLDTEIEWLKSQVRLRETQRGKVQQDKWAAEADLRQRRDKAWKDDGGL